MAKGDRIIVDALTRLESTAVLDFYKVYPDYKGKPSSYYNIHPGTVFGKGLYWQSELYYPIPVETEGFETSSNRKPNRPIFRISNRDSLITALLQNNNDFKNAKIERSRTLVQFIDDQNFEGGYNPWGETNANAEISLSTYYVSQKRQENKVFVEFELTTPLDLATSNVTNRRIFSKYCNWKYRGPGCEYTGKPIERADGRPFTEKISKELITEKEFDFKYADPDRQWSPNKTYLIGDVIYIVNDRVRIEDPKNPNIYRNLLVYYVCKASNLNKNPLYNSDDWDRDACGKNLGACGKRFSNTTDEFQTNFAKVENVPYSVAGRLYEQQNLNLGANLSDHIVAYNRLEANSRILLNFGDVLPALENQWGQTFGNDDNLKKGFTLCFNFAKLDIPNTRGVIPNRDDTLKKEYCLLSTRDYSDIRDDEPYRQITNFHDDMSITMDLHNCGELVLNVAELEPYINVQTVRAKKNKRHVLISREQLVDNGVELLATTNLLITVSKGRGAVGDVFFETNVWGVFQGGNQFIQEVVDGEVITTTEAIPGKSFFVTNRVDVPKYFRRVSFEGSF